MQNEIVAETTKVWLHKTRKEQTCKLNNEQNRIENTNKKLVINYANFYGQLHIKFIWACHKM